MPIATCQLKNKMPGYDIIAEIEGEGSLIIETFPSLKVAYTFKARLLKNKDIEDERKIDIVPREEK